MGWSGAIQMGIQNFTGGLQQYVTARAQEKEAKRNARMAEANAEATAKNYEAQAKVADIQAANAQRQGEIEANKRSRLMAQDVGSIYANAAGNGLMVDGSGKDTVGDVLKTTADEAQFDISTIRENADMNVWTYQQTAEAYRTSKSNALKLGKMQSDAYKEQAQDAKVAGKQGIMQSISGIPSTIWSMAGVKSYTKFGGIFGSTVAGNPFTNGAGVYGLAKG